jgi:EmrB/QacA subfamily drug resistance transporter
MPHTSTSPSLAPKSRRALIPIALAASITALDTTVVTVAAPSIRNDLHLSLTDLEWMATSYVLAFASLLLVGGRLTDILGRRRMLQWGMATFAIASIVVAMAPDRTMLLVGRGVQGIGAAIVVPAVLAMLAADLPEEDRHLGSGVFAASAAGSLALGPVFGGVVSEHWHWSWIFWLNLPVVAITVFSVRWAIPALADAGERISRREWWLRLDLPGLVFSSLALGGVTYALLEGQQLGLESPLIWSAVGLSVASLICAVICERRAAYPLLELELLRHPVVAGGTGVQIIWGLAINGVFFFMSLFLQDVLAMSPTVAGLCFMPLAFSIVFAVPLSAWAARRWGAHRTIGVGMIMVTLGLWVGTWPGPGADIRHLLPGFLLVGVGTALTTPIASAMLSAVPPERAGVVSAVVSVAREVSGALGIAVMGSVLVLRQTAAAEGGAPAQEAFLSGYRTAVWLAGVLCAVGAVIAWRWMDTRAHPPIGPMEPLGGVPVVPQAGVPVGGSPERDGHAEVGAAGADRAGVGAGRYPP